MSEEWLWAFNGLLLGILIGWWLGNWAQASHWRGKSGDEIGHRTAMCSGGKFYYVVSEREYVDKIMGPP